MKRQTTDGETTKDGSLDKFNQNDKAVQYFDSIEQSQIKESYKLI